MLVGPVQSLRIKRQFRKEELKHELLQSVDVGLGVSLHQFRGLRRLR